MTFSQARAISKENKLHVRRESWPATKWFIIWRGHWFTYPDGPAGKPHSVRAGDYNGDDLTATDWTTVPAALAGCPIDPTIGSTGGGAPTPGVGGFALDPGISPFPSAPGTGGGGGFSLPPPDPGTSLTVVLNGITAGLHFWYDSSAVPSGRYSLRPSGAGVWVKTFTSGYYQADPVMGVDQPHYDATWTITVNLGDEGVPLARGAAPIYRVTVGETNGGGFQSGGLLAFQTLFALPKGTIINNNLTGAEGFANGTAKVI